MLNEQRDLMLAKFRTEFEPIQQLLNSRARLIPHIVAMFSENNEQSGFIGWAETVAEKLGVNLHKRCPMEAPAQAPVQEPGPTLEDVVRVVKMEVERKLQEVTQQQMAAMPQPMPMLPLQYPGVPSPANYTRYQPPVGVGWPLRR